jgi:hypothetical protein
MEAVDSLPHSQELSTEIPGNVKILKLIQSMNVGKEK